MIESLTYIDENDRCYGLSGMAVVMSIFNNEEKIWEINIDRYPDAIDFTPEFYFSGNPRYSAKSAWDEIANNFHLALAMALGNLFSRKMIGSNENLSDVEEKYVRSLLEQEGYETCGLEQDEVDAIWAKDYSYIRRVFSHPTVIKTTETLASELKRRRVLSRHELLELLLSLSR